MALMSNRTITLNHAAHGGFTVDADKLTLAVAQYGSASLYWIRKQVEGHAGYTPIEPEWAGRTSLDDCSLIECLIIWVESGNHPW